MLRWRRNRRGVRELHRGDDRLRNWLSGKAIGLDLDRGLLRLCLRLLGCRRLSLLTLGLSLSLLLSFQCPDLGLHQLLLLRRHSSATLAELMLNSGGESLLLRDVHLASNLWHALSNPIREL